MSNIPSVISVKLHLRDATDRRTNGRTDNETRLFVRCVCQGRPSYVEEEPRCFVEILGEDKNPASTNKYMKIIGQLIIRKIIKIIATRCHIL